MSKSVPTAFLSSPDVDKLEDWGPLEEATGPVMNTSGVTMWKNEAGAEAGIWECTPGPSRWTFDDENEFIHIVSGRMTVTPDGGEPLEIGPGNTAVFPAGWTGTWEIHATVRKLYVFY